MEQIIDNFTCNKEDYDLKLVKSNMESNIQKLKELAFDDGFYLTKMTGNKSNSFYFQCHRSGKPRNTDSQGKRAKSSKKISKINSY